MALNRLIEAGDPPDLLLTTINQQQRRIGMHGLHESLLVRQVEQIGIPYKIVELSESLDHHAYNELMKKVTEELKSEGFDRAAFGDIFLEDLRNYREEQLRKNGIQSIFPLWKEDTRSLIKEFVELGFRSCVLSASKSHFKKDFMGSEIDGDFLDRLPKEVDPCGENGEYHSFCYDGPIFKKRVNFTKGELVVKSYPAPTKDNKDDQVEFYFLELE